jgi:hypothetical protein
MIICGPDSAEGWYSGVKRDKMAHRRVAGIDLSETLGAAVLAGYYFYGIDNLFIHILSME